MTIHLLALGTRLPTWIQAGFDSYAKRLQKPWDLHLHEIPLPKRTEKTNAAIIREMEGTLLLAKMPKEAYFVALDERGPQWSTVILAKQIARWMRDSPTLYLGIGGPDGFSDACLSRANQTWSLSPLTLPHGLVRILVAEQIYRVFSLHQGHPYHRE